MSALLTLLLLASAPSEPHELLVTANAAYERGDYDAAASAYRELVERGHDGGHVLYNLGNAYLRSGKLGPAIAAYRASAAKLPRDADVEANLTFARKQRRDALTPPSPSAAARTLLFWHYALSAGELAVLTLLANAVFWLLLIVALVRHTTPWRWSAGAALAITLASGGSLAAHHLAPERVAVVIADTVDVRSGTSADTVVRFQLHEGAEVLWDERDGDWVRVALPDGTRGWAPAGRFVLAVTDTSLTLP